MQMALLGAHVKWYNEDPEKYPKTWKSIQDILSKAKEAHKKLVYSLVVLIKRKQVCTDFLVQVAESRKR